MAKPTIANKIKSWSNPILILVVVAVLLAGGLVGFGVGYKVGHHNSAKKAALVPKSGVKPKTKLPLAVNTTGTVGTATATSMTVIDAKKVTRRFILVKSTMVLKTSKGSTSDLKVGVRVRFKVGAKKGTAKEVLVMPAGQTKFGLALTAASPTSISFLYLKAKTVKVDVSGATIDKAAAGTKADANKGARVMVQGQRTKKGLLIATEIVVLPAGSAFV